MSGHPGYNPYAAPANDDEFVATGYDQYQPANPAPAADLNPYSQPATSQPHALPQPPAHQQAYTQQTYAPSESYEMQDQSNLQFFNEVDDIKRNLVQYEDNIERIETLHKRSLAESNLESEALMQKQLDGLQTDTRGLAETLKTRIKQLEASSQHDSTKSAQAQNLKHQFMSMIQKFQATEAAFRQRYRDVTARQYRIIDPEATEEQVQQVVDEGSGQMFSQALMQSNRRGEARSALTEVQIRHREIQKIEATMSELAQLFHDMEIMVAEQDQQVTNVEQNVHSAQTDIEQGVDNQYSAIRSAKAWRKKKWWCVALIVVVLLFIILFFSIYFGGGHND